MTREEKSNLLNELLEYEEKNDIGNLTRAERGEFQQWINDALEQEPILDKIRAEIEKQKTTMNMFNREDTKQYAIAMEDVLKIIDKYKAKD